MMRSINCYTDTALKGVGFFGTPGETRFISAMRKSKCSPVFALAQQQSAGLLHFKFESLCGCKNSPSPAGDGLFLAPPARLELTTLRLGGVRSIQVSYGGVLPYCTEILCFCQ